MEAKYCLAFAMTLIAKLCTVKATFYSGSHFFIKTSRLCYLEIVGILLYIVTLYIVEKFKREISTAGAIITTSKFCIQKKPFEFAVDLLAHAYISPGTAYFLLVCR